MITNFTEKILLSRKFQSSMDWRYVPGIRSEARLARNSVEQTSTSKQSSCQHTTLHQHASIVTLLCK